MLGIPPNFTRKQWWRGVRANSRRRSHQREYEDYLANRTIPPSTISNHKHVTFEQEIRHVYQVNDAIEEWSEVIYESKSNKDVGQQYKVLTFNPLVEVCFVPTRYECGPLLRDLYWRPEDYDYFKQDALCEIRTYWKRTGIPTKEAIVALYQPICEAPTIPVMAKMDSAPSLLRLSEKRLADELSTSKSSSSDNTGLSIGTVMKHVDSLVCMTDLGADAELLAETADFADTDNESTSTVHSDVKGGSFVEGKASWSEIEEETDLDSFSEAPDYDSL
jgi:hypothetical protein